MFKALLTCCMLIGLLAAMFGTLEWMAGGMSDAPAEGEKAGKHGCIVAIVGIALIAVAACGLRQ